jgi:predicted nucleotidyltransferase
LGGRTFVPLIGSRLTGVRKADMDIQNIVTVLAEVPGVSAIALGGSQSRKQADKNSDYDIGIYYKNQDLDLITLADC